jgi:hypothetical protein
VKTIGSLIWLAGVVAVGWIVVLGAIWLYSEYGFWLMLLMVLLGFPLFLVVPFLAGYAVPYAIALVVMGFGWLLEAAGRDRAERKALSRGSDPR